MILRFFFFFNDTATTEIYTLSLHDALPIFLQRSLQEDPQRFTRIGEGILGVTEETTTGVHRLYEMQKAGQDRKSTRLNSSHANISYAVFCLKKKTITHILTHN